MHGEEGDGVFHEKHHPYMAALDAADIANPAVVLLVVNPEFRPLETHIDLTPSFTTQGFQGNSPLLVSCRPISFFRTQLTCWKSTRALMIASGVSRDSSAPPQMDQTRGK